MHVFDINDQDESLCISGQINLNLAHFEATPHFNNYKENESNFPDIVFSKIK